MKKKIQTPRFKGVRVEEEGKPRIAIGNPPRYFDYLKTLRLNQDVWISIEVEENKRSPTQNNFYHVYLDRIADKTGDRHEALHEGLRRDFLAPVRIHYLGKERLIPRSTSDLSKAEFSEYLEKIKNHTGIPLPDPEAEGYISNTGLIR